jgi:hypothetical protein
VSHDAAAGTYSDGAVDEEEHNIHPGNAAGKGHVLEHDDGQERCDSEPAHALAISPPELHDILPTAQRVTPARCWLRRTKRH